MNETEADVPWAGRRLFFEDIDRGQTPGLYPENPRHQVTDPAEANLVSSIADGMPPWMHMPVIDIDHPCDLVHGPGRSTLTIARMARLDRYTSLLGTLRECGIGGYPDAAPAQEGDQVVIVLGLDVPCRLLPSTTEGHFHLYIGKAIPWYEFECLLRVMVHCGLVEDGYYQAARRRCATFVRMPGVSKPLAEYRGVAIPDDVRRNWNGNRVEVTWWKRGVDAAWDAQGSAA